MMSISNWRDSWANADAQRQEQQHQQRRFAMFTLSGAHANVPFANALRRTILCGVPTVAPERIFFYFNDTVLNNQLMAIRLMALPLEFASFDDIDSMSDARECICSTNRKRKRGGGGGYGCLQCSIVGMCDVTNDEREVRIVTDRDIVWMSPRVRQCAHTRSDRSFELVELAKGQRIAFAIVAQKGIEGANISRKDHHSKFAPTIVSTYREVASATLPTQFEFSVETTGVLSAREVVRASLVLMKRDIDRVESYVKKQKYNNVL